MKAVRWIWDYFKDFRTRLMFCNILFIFEQMTLIAAQGSQKFLIDDVFVGKQYEKIVWIMLYLVATYLSSFMFNFFAQYVTKTNQLLVNRRMSQNLMEDLLNKPISLIHNERTAKWVQYFTSDIQNVAMFITTNLSKGVQHTVAALVLLGCITWASPILLLVTVFFSAVYVWLGKYYGPIMRQQSRKIQERRGEVLVRIEEGIASTREVIAYNRNEWESNNFKRAFSKLYKKVMENGRVANTQLLLSNTVQWTGRISILVYGGYSVISGNLSLGTFVVVYQFANQFFSMSQELYNFFINMAGQLAFVERVKTLFDQTKIPSGTLQLQDEVRSIELDGIKFSYSEEHEQVLRGLTTRIPCQQKIAIVGTSGGGKSTVAQLLVRLYNPNEGSIRINDNLDLSQIRGEDWLSRISIVFQDPFLLQDTIKNNLLLGRDIPWEKVEEACRAAQIHDFIETLDSGYDTLIGERGYTLSGGQRQRLAIARAILENPEILILDEATSALDVETEHRLQKCVDELREGRTTIVIAHRLSTVRNANLILVMDGGQLAEQGTHEELMRKGSIYPRLVATAESVGA